MLVISGWLLVGGRNAPPQFCLDPCLVCSKVPTRFIVGQKKTLTHLCQDSRGSGLAFSVTSCMARCMFFTTCQMGVNREAQIYTISVSWEQGGLLSIQPSNQTSSIKLQIVTRHICKGTVSKQLARQPATLHQATLMALANIPI